MSDRSAKPTASRRRPWARFDVATVGVGALGLLFWARLIVITDMPRTAIADEPPATVSDNPDAIGDETPDEPGPGAAVSVTP